MQLISVNDIKTITSISKNINTELLEPYILIGEEFYVYPVMGDSLVSELKNQIALSAVTSINQTLLNTYIKPLASYGAWLEASPFLNFKTVTKGIVKQSSDNSENLSMEELAFYRQSLKDKVSFFKNRLKEYLENNASSYPLYRSSSCKWINNNYSNGIYLGKNN